MTRNLQELTVEMAAVEFNRLERSRQKEMLEIWAAAAIEVFQKEPHEQWRLICTGEAIQATLAGLYPLARQMLSEATGLSDEVSSSFLNSISDVERELYTLERLPEHLEFVRGFPVQPHPIFGFKKQTK